ncbi:F-box protein CPR1-like isoform X2 [Rhododendron vialii]|uniref:F-box protein CPR1-like isoform X2 n=1 Tax=Rhododendron vialii TaxID=182163 RepID=UPI00265E3F47|nr:F-box protein CPR1-like isoform X2 [Rhododendron vialii]XP_058215574.1 F-box protein CPR1-like isoform X2 [Rhododendron vialii]XP_058215576.1 F-box protein CPR1-like isoform X2 [Rhododendron vialii]
MPNLPDEIIFDILSRLPVVSLCRFRCVSKPWRSLISHPHFIRTQIANNKHERVILRRDDNLYSVDLESSQFGDKSVQAILKIPTEYLGFDVYGSCDGLLLIGDYLGVHYYLANPSTREFRKLPPSPFKLHSWNFLNFYGFGYDSRSHDFKVVSISRYSRDSADCVVSLYALRTNSWKKIEYSPCGHSVMGDNSGVLVSGALHWFARTSMSTVILAVDLAVEKIRTIPTLDCTGFDLFVHGGCLWVKAKFYDSSRADFWVMKEYGVGESWTKFTVTYDRFHNWRPLSSLSADRVLFRVNNKKLVLYDPQEEKSKELVVHGLPIDFVGGTYVESLVSPNGQC